MKTKVFRSGALEFLHGGLPVIVLTLPIAAVMLFGLWQIEASSREEGRRLLEDSIKNAVVRHYAVEGSYPSGISVVESHYGVYIDRARYAVFYEIFAPNIMPEITVLELTRSSAASTQVPGFRALGSGAVLQGPGFRAPGSGA